jgi:uncharacterized protein YjbI with pentapeptide repeats
MVRGLRGSIQVIVLLVVIIASIVVSFVAGGEESHVLLWSIRVVAALVAIVAIGILIGIGYKTRWTGFGESGYSKQDNQEIQPRKTLWDWLDLLIVPVALAGIGLWFTVQQDVRQHQIEDRRAKAERAIQEQNAQDAELQAYLDQMSSLLLKGNLLTSQEGGAVRTLARARTLTVLATLDPSRKTQVLQFLVEANLVQAGREGEDPDGRDPIILLGEVTHSITPGEKGGADLVGVDLSNADLFGAFLISVDLSNAYLVGAVLNHANLTNADLSNAVLDHADLSNAVLDYANLSKARLYRANLVGAVLYNKDAREQGLNPSETRANLTGADLTRANLEGATVADEQLAQAKFLEGATMPDGQVLKGASNPNGPTFEEWLKSKGSNEEQENSGPS